MSEIETTGEESVLVAGHGEDVAVAVTHPRFGRIASVRLDAVQALLLAEALERAVTRSEEIA